MTSVSRRKVSLCMIVRNEEQHLRACLEPVAEMFDEIIVVDTGSLDRTKEIAIELGAQVSEFAWCDDFSAARNAALDRATGDYIFWLDADDRLDAVNRQRLQELLSRLGSDNSAYVMNCVSPAERPVDGAMVTSHCRLFPRLAEVRWARRIHEQIQPSVEQAGCPVRFSKVEVQHLGYQDPAFMRRKLNRDLRLLRLEHAIDPTDPVTLFNLGTTQLQIGMTEDALTSLLSSLKNATGQADWQRRLYSLASTALQRLNRREEALAIVSQGLQKFPADADLLTQQANLLGQIGDLGGAERALLRLLRAPQEDYLVAGSRNVLDRREARCLLGMVYRDQGRHDAAERVLQELLGEFPDFVQAWVGLGYVYLAQRHFANLNHVCQQLQKCPDGAVYALILQAEGLIARDDLAPARALLDEAICQAPRMIWPRLVLAGWLTKTGAAVEQCRQAQRDILRLDPGNALALENLALLEQRSALATGSSPLSWTITV